MKNVKLGSSIKVIKNGKEDFLTVDVTGGAIILHKRGRIITKRSYNGSTFSYNNEQYTIKR